MKKIIFATGNEDKMKEIRRILADPSLEILSLKDAGIHADIDENGKSFEENAMIKAEAISKMTGEIVLADDSGLEIDYLNKEPGIYSARYMGEDTSYHIKNANLIQRLEGVPDEKRTARFVCAIAAVFPDGRRKTVRAAMEGRIGYEEKGENGFGRLLLTCWYIAEMWKAENFISKPLQNVPAVLCPEIMIFSRIFREKM